jgi:hypothetical protein
VFCRLSTCDRDTHAILDYDKSFMPSTSAVSAGPNGSADYCDMWLARLDNFVQRGVRPSSQVRTVNICHAWRPGGVAPPRYYTI